MEALGPLTQVQFAGSIWQNGTSPTFYYGYTGTDYLVIGAVPFNVIGGDYFIKVFDGSSGAVAVSSQQVDILPNIYVSPDMSTGIGYPAGYPVTVTGAAWGTPSLVNITVYHFNDAFYMSTIVTPVNGAFSWTFKMPDEGKLDNNPFAAATYTPYVEAFNTTTGHLPALVPSLDLFANINYIGRAFYNIWSFDNTGYNIDSATSGPYDSTPNGMTTAEVDAVVLGTIMVNGTDFYSSGTVTAFADYGLAGQVAMPLTFISPVNAMGYFNASFTVPDLPVGYHMISFVDNSWDWNFTIYVETSLAVTPSSGTCSNPTTSIRVQGWGFDSNTTVTVYFLGIVNTFRFDDGDLNDFVLIANMTTSLLGGFTTAPFTIPETFGGWHFIYANTTGLEAVPTTDGGAPAPGSPDPILGSYAVVSFWVNDSYAISTTTAAVGTIVTITGEGLGTGHIWGYDYSAFPWYSGYTLDYYLYDYLEAVFGTYYAAPAIVYDNIPTLQASYQLFSQDDTDGWDIANATGQWSSSFVAAGVPMIHVVQVFDVSTDNEQYGYLFDTNPAALKATFMLSVTGSTYEGSEILSQLSGLSTSMTTLQTSVSNLATSVSSLTTTVNAIQSSLTALSTSVTSLSTQVSGVSTAVSGLQSSMNTGFTSVNAAITSLGSSDSASFASLTTAVAGVNTAVGGVNTAVGGVSSQVSTLSGNVATLSGQVTSQTSTVNTINSNTANLGTMTTVLYIAIILVAIAVVLEIVILIRKK